MPTSFNRALETPMPSIAINELPQDTSKAGAAKMVAGAITDYAETWQKAQDEETVGNFNNDLSTYEQLIDDLTTQADLSRIEAQQRMNVVLRNEGASESEKEQARIAFAQEMEGITMREEQQGLVLESQKRALVRKWSSIRPDMTQEFQKTIAMNKALYELDRVGPKTSSTFKKVQEQQATAVQIGLTPEYVQRQERTAALALEARNALDIKVSAGKAKEGDFMLVADSYVDASLTAIMGFAGEAKRAAASGNAVGVTRARGAMVEAITAMRSNLQTLRLQFNAEHNVLVDTSNLEKYIDDTTKMLLNSFTTGDARDVAAIADMAAEDSSAIFAQNFLRSYYGFDLPPKLAVRQVNLIFDGITKMQQGSFYKNISKPGGFENVIEQARIGDPEASQSLWLFRVVLPQFVRMSRDPNAQLSPDQLEIVDSVIRSISEGQLPTAQMAAKAGPLIAALYKGVEVNPNATDEEKKNAGVAIERNTWESFSNNWRQKDIINQNSDGARKLRTLPDAQYNKEFSQFVEKPIMQEYVNLDPELRSAIKLNPNDNVRPFVVEWPEGVAVHGGSRFSDITKFVGTLNEGYRARANTRRGSEGEALPWARDFYDTFLSPAIEGESVTNNEGVEEVTVTAPIVITEGDMAKYGN